MSHCCIYSVHQLGRPSNGLAHSHVLELIHFSGQEEYERLRPLSYSKAHVILIAYSVDSPDSLENVTQKVGLCWADCGSRNCVHGHRALTDASSG